MLQELRVTLQKLVPAATETISYGMPAFKYNNKILVYFAGWKNHIGFYPTGKTIHHLEALVQNYTYFKGFIHFPHSAKLPKALIKEIILFRTKEICNITKKNI